MAHPLPLRIVVQAADERELAARFGKNLAPGGIRLPTQQIRRPGDLIEFELAGRDGTVLLHGTGTVVRVLEGAEPSERALLVRYDTLPGGQRATLDRLLLMRDQVSGLGLPVAPNAESVAVAPPRAVLALDVGGTYARAAIVRDGRPVLVNVAGPASTALPAAVALDEKDRLLFGARARAQRALEPRSGLPSPLPLLTLDPRAARDDHELGKLPFAVQDGPQGPVAELPHQTTPVVDLFAAVVKELKGRAQEAAQQPLTEAHLAIPPTLDMRAKHLLQLGLRRAGFGAPVLVDAALAVAVQHGYAPDVAPPGPLLVVDWGGTTLEVAVLANIDGRLDVLAAGQKRHLGGVSIDERIARSLLEPVERALGAQLLDPLARQRLLDAAEQARVTLASQPEVQVRIPFLAMRADGTPVDLDVRLDAANTLRVLEPALDQLLKVIAALLETSGTDPAAVHQVLLAGGQCAWPRVAERLEARFPGRVASTTGAANAVVLGTAKIASARLKRTVRAGMALESAVSVMGAGGRLLRLFAAGTALPAHAEIRIQAEQGQGVVCPLVEGAAVASGAGYLGAVVAPRAVGEIRLTAEIDARRILDVDLAWEGGQAHARFGLHEAEPGISAAVFAELPQPGDREAEAQADPALTHRR